jgi:cation diffusion facilitator CzcD-associated flavoprotein CzcO
LNTTFSYHYTMSHIKSVAVIGAGPGGAITVDALAQEKSFDVIRVFDRQEHAGGCWYVTFQ